MPQIDMPFDWGAIDYGEARVNTVSSYVEVWRGMFLDSDLDPKTIHSSNKNLDDH